MEAPNEKISNTVDLTVQICLVTYIYEKCTCAEIRAEFS
jgi:hypothetical protein